MMPMHYDYHVVALTSSTYGIMKLVEAEKYAVNDEELLESNLVSAGYDHHRCCGCCSWHVLEDHEEVGVHARSQFETCASSDLDGDGNGYLKVGADYCRLGEDHDQQRIARSEEEQESVKTPLKNEISSCSNNWEQEELETINTWELMAGLDDLTLRPSPLPVADPPPLQFSEAAAASHDDDSSLQKDLEISSNPY